MYLDGVLDIVLNGMLIKTNNENNNNNNSNNNNHKNLLSVDDLSTTNT